jgi:predicted RNA-binding protein Jag
VVLQAIIGNPRPNRARLVAAGGDVLDAMQKIAQGAV